MGQRKIATLLLSVPIWDVNCEKVMHEENFKKMTYKTTLVVLLSTTFNLKYKMSP